MLKKGLLFLFSIFLSLNITATTLSEKAEISLLTCSPGEIVYELFGHSAIRVYDPVNHIDSIYNYGLFDFNQSNFIYRFLRGKTDYEVGRAKYSHFLYAYAMRGSAVSECILNINQKAKQDIYDFLTWNCKEENKTYRYNFIFDNCATRVRDIIEVNSDCYITYLNRLDKISYRDAIKTFTKNAEWSQLGFDLCLGVSCDETAKGHELVFLPQFLEKAVLDASYSDSLDVEQKLCLEKIQVLPEQNSFKPALFRPQHLGYILIIICLVISVIEFRRKRHSRVFDAVFFNIYAFFGFIILFLAYFSSHPFTDHNYNLIWLNPLYSLTILPCLFKKARKGQKFFYGIMVMLLSTFIVLTSYSEQSFNPAVNIFVIPLILRSVSYFVMRERRKHRKPFARLKKMLLKKK